MKYALIPTAAFVAAAVCAVYFALAGDAKPKAQPVILARDWSTPRLEQNFAPMKSVEIALHTSRGWIPVSGCEAATEQAYKRAILICK